MHLYVLMMTSVRGAHYYQIHLSSFTLAVHIVFCAYIKCKESTTGEKVILKKNCQFIHIDSIEKISSKSQMDIYSQKKKLFKSDSIHIQTMLLCVKECYSILMSVENQNDHKLCGRLVKSFRFRYKFDNNLVRVRLWTTGIDFEKVSQKTFIRMLQTHILPQFMCQ